MIVLISPAKNLDFDSELTINQYSEAVFLTESQQIMDVLKMLKQADLEGLMKISPKLSDLNYERNQNWSLPMASNASRQAVLAFNGEVYNGLNFSSFSKEQMTYSQNHLRILSGLYGILKPLDQILPYRLEMGTRLGIKDGQKNLYQFWDLLITEQINKLLKDLDSEIVLNLASNEYFKSVKVKALNARVVTPIFKDKKEGFYKVVMMYAKHARGVMSAYVLKNQIEDVEALKTYTEEGYMYNQELSVGDDWVFTRG